MQLTAPPHPPPTLELFNALSQPSAKPRLPTSVLSRRAVPYARRGIRAALWPEDRHGIQDQKCRGAEVGPVHTAHEGGEIPL